MEKRSRRRVRDLVTHLAFEGLAENEIGCARISMVARSNRSTNGPDTDEQDHLLPLNRFSLQRTAGPYNWVMCGWPPGCKGFVREAGLVTCSHVSGLSVRCS